MFPLIGKAAELEEVKLRHSCVLCNEVYNGAEGFLLPANVIAIVMVRPSMSLM